MDQRWIDATASADSADPGWKAPTIERCPMCRVRVGGAAETFYGGHIDGAVDEFEGLFSPGISAQGS